MSFYNHIPILVSGSFSGHKPSSQSYQKRVKYITGAKSPPAVPQNVVNFLLQPFRRTFHQPKDINHQKILAEILVCLLFIYVFTTLTQKSVGSI